MNRRDPALHRKLAVTHPPFALASSTIESGTSTPSRIISLK